MKLPDFLTGHASRDAFARQLVKAFAKKGYAHVRYDAQKFAISIGTEDEPEWIFLGNFYPQYREAPWFRRSAVVRQLVELRIDGMAEAKSHAPSVDKLLPVIRDAAYTWFCRAQIRAISKDVKHHISGIPMGENHQALLVLDSPTQTQQVDDAALASLNLDFADAMAQAVHNLRSISPDKWRTIAPGVFMGAWDDTFDCSRILLTDLIYRLSLPQNPVALMPARGVLLVTSSTNPQGQLAILAVAEKLLDNASHWISAQMLELADGRWRPFVLAVPPHASSGSPPGVSPSASPGAPPSVSQLHMVQHRLHLRLQSSKYDQQKGLLEDQLKEQGRDIFVASFMVYTNDKGMLSVATWSQGVEAWLPRADYIMFVKPHAANPSQDAFAVPWDVAHYHLAADMVEVPDVLPVRYQVSQFPDPAMLQVLRAQRVAWDAMV